MDRKPCPLLSCSESPPERDSLLPQSGLEALEAAFGRAVG